MTDLIILSMLLPGPKHGYQLKQEAGIVLGQALHNNLVYPLLRRFMTRKWVKRRTAAGQRGQTKHLYSLTALGREQLIARLGTYTDQEARSAEGFRVRVGLFWVLQPDARHRILDGRETFLRARLARLGGVETGFPLNRHAREVIVHMRGETESELAWIANLRTLEKSRKDVAHD